MNIWVLSHQYDYGDLCDKYKWDEEGRILGVYYTKKEALKSLIEYQKIRGFSSHLDGFCIEKCKLDKNLGWKGGFETTYYNEVKDNNNLFQEIKNDSHKKIYLVGHFHYINNKLDKKFRILSICSSKKEAKTKIKKYQKIKGFSSYISNFYIEEYILDEVER